MNKNLLNTGVQEFINKNLNTDIVSVLLKKPIFEGISNQELAEQLEARKKCEKKLPTWFKTPKIYYPDKLNIEQTSSEITAQYKAGIVSGKCLLDATGGLGVDSYFFSHKIGQVYHCEIDKNLSRIADYDFNVLGAKNITSIPVDGLKFLAESKTMFDWIYVDPSRRNDTKRKVFMLSDCIPNVLAHINLLFSKSDHILLKTAPLLDISMGIRELKNVREIHVVAVSNEVKELLWVLEKGYLGKIQLKTINFTKHGAQNFDFLLDEEKKTVSSYAEPLCYLYEPNGAILKSGAFKILGNRLQLKKLQEHTHLYTSDKSIDFPGRAFKVHKILPYNKNAIKRSGIKKANITTRNFPERVAEIRKKFDFKDGGGIYLFFTTDTDRNKIIIVCSKL